MSPDPRVAGSPPADNPLRAGMRQERLPDPCALVIFGASGDLTRRKLVPALFGLAAKQLLPAGLTVIGSARSDGNDTSFRNEMREAVAAAASPDPVDPATWDAFAAGLLYGLHEEWPLQQCLDLGHLAAAACMGHETTTGGLRPVSEL